jgi:hypothetical protein
VVNNKSDIPRVSASGRRKLYPWQPLVLGAVVHDNRHTQICRRTSDGSGGVTDAVRDLVKGIPVSRRSGFELSCMADGRHVLVNAFADPTSGCGGQVSVACAQSSSVGYVGAMFDP